MFGNLINFKTHKIWIKILTDTSKLNFICRSFVSSVRKKKSKIVHLNQSGCSISTALSTKLSNAFCLLWYSVVSSDQQASLLAGRSTGIVLESRCAEKSVPTAILGRVDIPEYLQVSFVTLDEFPTRSQNYFQDKFLIHSQLSFLILPDF